MSIIKSTDCRSLLLLPLLLFSLIYSSAQAQFGSPNTILWSEISYPSEMVKADLNGDQNPDILISDQERHRVAWYPNQVDTMGAQRVIADSIWGASDVEAADLDGDRDLDVLAVSPGTPGVTWFENTADGFKERQKISEMDSPTLAKPADLDGDDDMDIIIAGSDSLLIWHEQTDSGFDGPTTISESLHTPRALTIVDIDGDGKLDIITASLGFDAFSRGRVAWFKNTGSDFEAARIISSSFNDVVKLLAEDLTGDDKPDLVIGSDVDQKIAWAENNGSGFNNPTELRLIDTFRGVKDLLITDVDDNGDKDIVYATFNDDIAWFLNFDSDFSEALKAKESTGIANLSNFITLDINNDGQSDYFFTDPLRDQIMYHKNNNGELREAQPHPNSKISFAGPIDLSTGDIDSDGDKDIITATEHDKKVSWFENKDNGIKVGSRNFIHAEAGDVMNIFTHNLDGDNELDLLSTTYGKNLLHSNNSGIFDSKLILKDDFLLSTEIADIHNDEEEELIYYNAASDQLVWRSYTDGSFGNSNLLPVYNKIVNHLIAADINQDGDQDIAFSARLPSDESGIGWISNTEDGFSNPYYIDSVRVTHSMALTDLNGDRQPDLIAGVFSDSTSRLVWYQNGNEGFKEPQTIDQAGNIYIPDIKTIDIDKDGDQDIFGALRSTSGLLWLENTIDGMKKRVIHERTPAIQRVDFADLDGDGDQDPIYISNTADKLFWFENQMVTTSFEDKTSQTPQHVTLKANYPNPFNPTTTIGYSLPRNSYVELEIFNSVGQQVATLVSEQQKAGKHSVTFNASNLSSGVYIYRISTDHVSVNRKMILLK